MSFFSDFFERFSSVVRSIFSFMLPIAESAAGKVINDLLPTAMAIITQLESGQLSGADKRAAAFNELADQAKKEGLAAATSTLNLIIEMAVSKLNLSK